jgi:hypothetical protein
MPSRTAHAGSEGGSRRSRHGSAAGGDRRADRFDEVRFAVLLANAYIDHGDFGRAQETLGGILELARQTIDPLLRASLCWS